MTKLNDMMSKLLSESAEHKKHNKLMGPYKTMGESKKRRVSKTQNRILCDTIDARTEKRIQAGLERHHIRASVTDRICPKCKGVDKIVQKMEVISQTKAGDERVTGEINNNGAYQYHYDLPIVVNEYKEYGFICAKCLTADSFFRVEAAVA